MQTSQQPSRYTGLLAIMGLVALLAGLIIMLLLPEIRLAAWGVMGVGVILMASAFVLDFRRVRSALTGRRGSFSTGTTVMASIFIGITLLINGISINFYQRIDATALSEFTLTTQTKEVLGELNTPVEVLFFFGISGQLDILLRSYADNLLNQYQNYTDQLTVKFIDTDAQREQAIQYGVSAYTYSNESIYSTAVFKSENRRRSVYFYEMVTFDDQGQITAIEAEHAFTSAILEVTGTVQKRVYFLTGHGEASISSNEPSGYSNAREGLLDNLFQVRTLDLLATPSIPEDLAALIIAGPQQPLASSELDIIKRYIEDGGWVLFLLNPNSPQNIRELLTPWGVKFEDGTVIDTSSHMALNKDYPLVPRTRDLFSLAEVYFPGATAIIPQEKPPENLDMQPLVWTSNDSWLDQDFDPQKDPVFTEGVDINGPLALGVQITPVLPETSEEQAQFKGTRIVVFGDSDFASNQHFYNGNNGELFLNAVNYLTAGKELISIRRNVVPFRRLVVRPDEANFINYSSLALPPILVLIIGGVTWWHRR
ncbi:MAG TPA: GldG family protein [Dehalococcoidales bacterium]